MRKVALSKYTKEQIEETAMVDLAYDLLAEEKKAMHFSELFNIISEVKGLTKDEQNKLIVQFYTDLNVEGKIISVGQNMWGLKTWYPFEQIEDDILPFNEEEEKPKKKKKKKAAVEPEDELLVDEEEVDEEEDFDEDDLEEETVFDEDQDDEDTEFEDETEPLEFVDDEEEPYDDVNND